MALLQCATGAASIFLRVISSSSFARTTGAGTGARIEKVMTEGPIDGRLIIGVDIGGTKIAAGLVDDNGEINSRVRLPMVSGKGTAAGLGPVVAAIDAISGANCCRCGWATWGTCWIRMS